MFVCLCLWFIVPLENISFIWRRHHCQWRAHILTYARHLWPLRSEGSLVCHTYCDGASVCNGHLWGLDTQTCCWALRTTSTCFYDLGQSQLGFEQSTLCMRGEGSWTNWATSVANQDINSMDYNTLQKSTTNWATSMANQDINSMDYNKLQKSTTNWATSMANQDINSMDYNKLQKSTTNWATSVANQDINSMDYNKLQKSTIFILGWWEAKMSFCLDYTKVNAQHPMVPNLIFSKSLSVNLRKCRSTMHIHQVQKKMPIRVQFINMTF